VTSPYLSKSTSFDPLLGFLSTLAADPPSSNAMPRIGHLEVKIIVEDAYPLEFDDDDDEAEGSESVTTKYIEAVSGAKFGIRCKVLPGYRFDEDFLSFQVFLDGQRAGGKHFPREKHDNRIGEAALVTHAHMYGKDHKKSLKFRFADLETRK
jgi:hypothetical protein